MISKRVWKSAVARILTQQEKKQSIGGSIADILLAQIQKNLSASDVAAMLAERLLNSENQLDGKSLKQVDLEVICAKVGLNVTYQPLSVDAILQETESGFLAIINSLAKQSRQRKSLAHEIGHLMLYQATGLNQAFGHISINDRQSTESLEIEELCDCFASELLMPSKIWQQLIYTQGASLSTLKKLKDVYEVSVATAAQRMVEVSLIECAIIIWTPVYENNLLVKLDPVRYWDKTPSRKKVSPQSLKPQSDFLASGSPFDAIKKQSGTIGKISLLLNGIKGKYLAHSDIINTNYIVTILVPQHLGWETMFRNHKNLNISVFK